MSRRGSARAMVWAATGALVAVALGCASARPTPVEPAAAYALIDGQRVAVPDIAMGEPEVIERIIDEGMHRNRVMEHLTYLSTQIGPRLTGSSAAEAANRWARDQFELWGLSNAHLEQWGEIGARFDRGPSTGRVLVAREATDEQGETIVTYDELREMEFTWLAWSPGTAGPVRGPVMRMPTTLAELEAVEDELAGAWVLLEPDYSGRRGIRGTGGQMRARAQRRAELRAAPVEAAASPQPVQADAPTPAFPDDEISGRWTGTLRGPMVPDGIEMIVELRKDDQGSVSGLVDIPGYHRGPIRAVEYDAAAASLRFQWEHPARVSSYAFRVDGNTMHGEAPGSAEGEVYTATLRRGAAEAEPAPVDSSDEDAIERRVLLAGPAGFISSSKDHRVWTTSAPGWRELDVNDLPVDVEVNVRESDYDFMVARLAEGLPIYAEFHLDARFTPGPVPVYNTIADIPGTDWPEEMVIVSAHLDSWDGPGSQGTTDNGTGSAVTLEAARLLMAAGARPKRTIRFILWTGEEQGLLGSRAYVEQHADELERISAVFVDDGGTNYQGGLVCIEAMAPMLAAATAPVNGRFFSETDARAHRDDPDAGWLDVNIVVRERMPRGGGSDHASFNRAGVPGFFWTEVGRADYGYGWHTQNDRIDLAIPEYLAQSATCTAVTAYNLACAPTLLPREPSSPPDRERSER